ncbi:hypothetical protein K440DRAFT_645875 [Wilcoxina mikolae CBS 423.85]|nr:hypothetical protein K440DRAFT_645875 [Wilcoxina mikolae CBS 423.85]
MPNHIRRGVNVAAYLQNLNTIPSADEQIDAFNPDDLDLWTNTQFFDFDMGGQISHDPTETTREQKPVANSSAAIDPSLKEGGGFDSFLNEFEEFQNFEYSPTFAEFHSPGVQQPLPAATKTILPAVTPTAPRAPPPKPIVVAPIPPYLSPSAAPSPAPTASTATRASKRKVSVSSPNGSQVDSLEDASRLASEEDKRRRNTAASARFRVKKKQKEQQLEKTAKEMTDRVHQLEQRIQQLELENKWLKGLIVEKNGGKSGEEMLMPPSILAGSKDGVGTIGNPEK